MKLRTALTAAALGVSLAVPFTAGADEALAKSSNCLACHTVDNKILGPAFKDIAREIPGRRRRCRHAHRKSDQGRIRHLGQRPDASQSADQRGRRHHPGRLGAVAAVIPVNRARLANGRDFPSFRSARDLFPGASVVSLHYGTGRISRWLRAIRPSTPLHRPPAPNAVDSAVQYVP